MKKFYINGGNNLFGDVKISGSKNSILSILSSCLLSDYDILIKNVPNIIDVNITINLFKYLGSKIIFINNELYINNKYINKYNLPYKYVSKIRSSILFIPSILLRFGIVKTFVPGGCNFCERPIDIHLDIFKKFNINFFFIKNILN